MQSIIAYSLDILNFVPDDEYSQPDLDKLLVYADDIAIVKHSKRDVIAVYSALGGVSADFDLAMNERKTKHVLSIIREMRRIRYQITASSYTFDVVKEFICLSSAVTNKNESAWKP